MVMFGRDHSESPGPTSLLRQDHPRTHGTWLCPGGSWVSPVREMPQPLWQPFPVPGHPHSYEWLEWLMSQDILGHICALVRQCPALQPHLCIAAWQWLPTSGTLGTMLHTPPLEPLTQLLSGQRTGSPTWGKGQGVLKVEHEPSIYWLYLPLEFLSAVHHWNPGGVVMWPLFCVFSVSLFLIPSSQNFCVT